MNTLIKPFALALLAAIAISALVAIITSAQFFPVTTQSSNPLIGQAVFEAKCSGCHTAEPEGGRKMGPNLSDLGAVAGTRKPGMGAAEFILESIIDPDAYREPGVAGHMPKGTVDGVSEGNIRDMIAYLASRGATPDYAAILKLEIDIPQSNNLQKEIAPVAVLQYGWDLFQNTLGCAACHSIFHFPGDDIAAPSLAKAGQLSEDYIIESLRNPGKFIAPGYEQVTAKTKEGKYISGRLLSKSANQYEILLLNKHGHYENKKFAADELMDFTIANYSLMPPYQLSKTDEHAIVSFLKFVQSSDEG